VQLDGDHRVLIKGHNLYDLMLSEDGYRMARSASGGGGHRLVTYSTVTGRRLTRTAVGGPGPPPGAGDPVLQRR